MSDLFVLESPDDAAAYLREFSSSIRTKGENYFREGAVCDVKCEEPGRAYTANVSGSNRYLTEAYFDEVDGWGSVCSCPAGLDCSHAYALLKTLLAGHSQAVVQRLSSTSGKPPPLRAQPGPAPSPPPPSSAPGAVLAPIVAASLKRPLAPAERRLVGHINQVFHRCLAFSMVRVADLQELGFKISGHSWDMLKLWPSPPVNDHEFWLYIARFLHGRGIDLPEFLQPVTDLAGVEEHIRHWEREREIERWRGVLQRMAVDGEPAPTPVLDLRLRFYDGEATLECRWSESAEFAPLKSTKFNRLVQARQNQEEVEFQPAAAVLWELVAAQTYGGYGPSLPYSDLESRRVLHRALRQPLLEDRLVGVDGQPLRRADTPLRWAVRAPETDDGDYQLWLQQADGSALPPLLLSLNGRPSLFVSRDTVFAGPAFEDSVLEPGKETHIPAEVIESRTGLGFLNGLGAELPARLAAKVRRVSLHLKVRCELGAAAAGSETEQCRISLLAESLDGEVEEHFGPDAWIARSKGSRAKPGRNARRDLVIHDRSALARGPALLEPLGARWDYPRRCWYLRITKKFPEVFVPWLKALPADVAIELRGELNSFLNATVAGELNLDVQEAGIDWFDLRVVLNVSDTELTPDELKLLLDAKGRWVRLGTKGWRRLEFKLTQAEDEQLARLGLNPHELSGEPQRLHALQLADGAAKQFLPEAKFEQVQRRARELQARVTPEIPAAIKAELRPYQRDGFHFLAYLATNRFGGILADDMGLGKTLQTLTWLAWLRCEASGSEGAFPGAVPSALVVCPKSVMDNWRAEAERFVPGLGVRVWSGHEVHSLSSLADSAALHVINYAQLRLVGESLARTDFLAVILDEGQYIKNPSSITAQIARSLRARHRLVLSGTPIENRLLDLWSLMSFAMPGALGSRTEFTRLFDSKSDPFARRRLASRVRPFLLRRTKAQVATDLPDRIEEDLFCEIEGEQKSLYRAELKRAQQILLKLSTQAQLNKDRFHLLTSLLRLRQICCHPRLVKPDSTAEAAKLEALLEQLEPIMEEGHKVLVFSQFVEMLDLLKAAVAERGWPHFYLAGHTEERSDLVREFQSHDGAAVFLISLKAGGFGLNLTAASYVVLFDPWWNPAVEHQAIDRTHRIGQTQKVIAYRLLIKDSIEEKIRMLQKAKKALAEDVLGEERFTQNLTPEDLRFLFAD